MNTNQVFSLKRFSLLVRSDLMINYKKYLLTITGAFILGFVFLYGSMPRLVVGSQTLHSWEIFDDQRYMNIFIASIMALGVWVGSSFPGLGSKVKTANYLLIPSSTFEKFASQFFIRIVCGTAIFLILFWIDAQLARSVSVMQMVDAKTDLHYANAEMVIEKFNYGMVFLFRKIHQPEIIIYYKAIESWGLSFFAFSIGLYLFSVKLFFRRNGLVKTIISVVAVLLTILFIMTVFSHAFFPYTKGFSVTLPQYDTMQGINNMELWICSIGFLSPLFLLPLGYFKLKEKQL
ncbi:MAG TPA: hypothetical protein VK152_08565 [Paludibacter sp.]|nr:hypothetical protein [Paludibacter sp.]